MRKESACRFRVAAWLPALLLAGLALLARAQAPALPASAAAGAQDEAVVRIYGRPIATFRAPFLGVPPAGRARRTEAAIHELLAHGGPGLVSTQQEPQGNVVLIDGALALILTEQDTDPVRRETLDGLTRQVTAALARAVADTREARDQRRRLHAVGWSAVATVLYLGVLLVILRTRDALSRRIGDLLAGAAERAHVAGQALWEATRLHAFASWLVRSACWFLLVVFSYQWLVFVLQQFPATRVWGEHLGDFVLDLLEQLAEGAVRALPDLVVAFVIFLLARGLIGALRPVFQRAEQGHAAPHWLAADLAVPTRRIVSVAIWLFAIVMAYPYLPGSQSEAFKGMSVLVGLMITLGGSSLIGQAFSGLILMYGRVLRVGEYVRIGEHEGTVVDLGLFTSRVRTGMGQEVVLPNAVILGNVTTNYSRTIQGSGFIIDTAVTIGYDAPWRQVNAILLEAAHRTEGICTADPVPRVFHTALSDFYVEYRLVCQALPAQPLARAELLHMLHANVLDVFNEHGVQIMSPHYLGDPAAPKVVPPGDPYAAPRRPPAAASAESAPARATAAARPPTSP